MVPLRQRPIMNSKEKGERSSLAGIERHDDISAGSPDRVPCIQGDDGVTSTHNTAGYLQGPRLWTVSFLNATMLFLVQTEIFIVTTSLVAIAEELGGFDTASWLLAAYHLGYVSM